MDEIEFLKRKLMIDDYFAKEDDMDERRRAFKRLLLHYHPDKRRSDGSDVQRQVFEYLQSKQIEFKGSCSPTRHSVNELKLPMLRKINKGKENTSMKNKRREDERIKKVEEEKKKIERESTIANLKRKILEEE